MAQIYLDKLTYMQLLALQKSVAAAVAERRSAETQEIRQKLQDIAAQAGFNAVELFGKKLRRGPVAVKYRNPKNARQTWTGRGRKPNWLLEAIKKGAKIDSFAVYTKSIASSRCLTRN